MRSAFRLLSAVTAPGATINEDAFGIHPDATRPSAVWVLDGVTGLNERPLLPGPTDAAWFVAQVQVLLPALLAQEVERPVSALVRALSARQAEAWLDSRGVCEDSETPAASFALARLLGDEVEITRLGDCSVLIERHNGSVEVLRNLALERLEAQLKHMILELRLSGKDDPETIRTELLPALRAQRSRRNAPSGYGVLAPEQECLDMLMVERVPASAVRRILLASDGYYRLVDVYGAFGDAELIEHTELQGAEQLLGRLREIEQSDPEARRYPRLKASDDATAVLLRVELG